MTEGLQSDSEYEMQSDPENVNNPYGVNNNFKYKQNVNNAYGVNNEMNNKYKYMNRKVESDPENRAAYEMNMNKNKIKSDDDNSSGNEYSNLIRLAIHVFLWKILPVIIYALGFGLGIFYTKLLVKTPITPKIKKQTNRYQLLVFICGIIMCTMNLLFTATANRYSAYKSYKLFYFLLFVVHLIIVILVKTIKKKSIGYIWTATSFVSMLIFPFPNKFMKKT